MTVNEVMRSARSTQKTQTSGVRFVADSLATNDSSKTWLSGRSSRHSGLADPGTDISASRAMRHAHRPDRPNPSTDGQLTLSASD